MGRAKFDPLKSFIELPVLWWTIGILALLAAITSATIAYNSDLRWSFDADGFNYFVTAFKVPLGILALIIPIVALLAANHRSVQTKQQIESTKEQNIFSNYYKHIEEFVKYVEQHFKDERVTFHSVRKTHRTLFPEACFGNFNVSGALIEELKDAAASFIESAGQFEGGHRGTWEDTILQLHNASAFMASELGFSAPGSGRGYKVRGQNIVLKEGSLRGFFIDCKLRAEVVRLLLEFDQFAEIPSPISAISEAEINRVPDHKFDDVQMAPGFHLFR